MKKTVKSKKGTGKAGKDQMNRFTDWNCGLLPNGMELLGSVRDAASGLRILSERTGIFRFCFLPVFDPKDESLSCFLLRRDRAIHELSELLPKEFRLISSARMMLPRDGILPNDPKLKRLCIPKTNCLPLTFFLWDDPIEIENRLAKLVYHSDFSILLPAAERILSIFPQEVSERIFRLPGTVYQFSFTSLREETVLTVLDRLLRRKAPVLFGSSVMTPAQAARFDLDYDLQIARTRFDRFDFDALFYSNRFISK